MSDADGSQGPRLVWTFPLLTRVQSRSGILSSQSNVGQLLEDREVGDRVRQRISDDSDVEQSEGSSSVLDQMESKIDSVKQSGESTFSEDVDFSSENNVEEVSIENGAFLPTRVKVDSGDTVRWVNNSDEVHRISSINGEEFISEQIEPGESYEYTFNTSGATIYIDTIKGREAMSGVVIVDNADNPDTLPSESEDVPETFENGVDVEISPQNMEDAADEKQEMDKGF